MLLRALCLCACVYVCVAESDDDTGERDDSGEYNVTKTYTQTRDDLEDSEEHIGAAVTQVYKHPYAASLLKNDSYVCSAVVLNTYWLLTLSKCFDSFVISSYVSHKYLGNYTIRTGSNYNNKGGNISKIKMLINNFDFKVSAVKVTSQLVFDDRVGAVNLPSVDDDEALGYLASIVAWTPSGHIRVVNAPVIDSAICQPTTKLLPGHYICVGGVQDPNRHFCRKDNGGAVIQNNTLIAVSAFLHTCALYTKTHAFPKSASFARWLDSVIWDENNRPTTTTNAPTTQTTVITNVTETVDRSPYFGDPRKFMLTLPYDPVNVPLEPAEDNSVIPRMSLYESYLHNLAMARSSTPQSSTLVDEKKKWFEKFGKTLLMKQMYPKRYEYDYN
ncbi:trypsin-6-like [Colias croceus]|uniref:trypsin-6-like n=1 Tax=Colias crocea TaxID=72248 RepID=UPI001E27E9EC|nr:trypsin-6-like [Colias croceus]